MGLTIGSPEEAGLDPGRLQRAYDLLAEWVAAGTVPGVALAVARNGIQMEPQALGQAQFSAPERTLAADDIFLVASVTKPVTVMAALTLLENGALALDDLVTQYIPEFTGQGKEAIRLRQLMNHTSGLPDMLPDNQALRQQHAPLSTFIEGICACSLLFTPGTRVSYQSTGTAILGEVVERISGQPLREYFNHTFFKPLGMDSSALGWRQGLQQRIVEVVLPEEQVGGHWHWNSPYWRDFGAPWGGMFSTVQDLLRLLQALLQGGQLAGQRILGADTVQTMLTDQTPGLGPRWGLGWSLGGGGDLGSPARFGHGGATGTLVGADPASGLAWALFTNRPGAPLRYLANALHAAVV